MQPVPKSAGPKLKSWATMASEEATKQALLAPHEPSPVAEVNTAGGSPFLLVCDHAGRRIPRALGDLGVGAANLTRHIAWDIGIEGVARRLADKVDAHLIMQIYSRLVIDCNRPPGSAESIVTESDGTAITGNENISAQEAAARAREIFEPYHGAIVWHLDARKTAQRPVILIALHSFTPVYGGLVRPCQAGVLYNRYRVLADALRQELSAPGDLIVGDNEPYTVDDETDYTIPVHGETRGIPHVAIEIRQDLIGDEAGQEYWAARLAETLPKAAGLV
jgi:predicted N-formylglutamate amidohydrolase